jgi:predicted transcriptional regulator
MRLKQETALSICLIMLVLSISFVTIAYAAPSITNMSAVQDAHDSQQLIFSVPLVIGAGLHGNSTTLNQPTRLEIYAYVMNNPGVHFRGVCSGLGISVGVAQYHLSILVNAGLLKVYKDSPNKRYFESRIFAQTDVELISLIRHNTAGKILTVLAQKGSILHKDLAQTLHMSSQALTWQMTQLKKAGLVEGAKEGMSVRYILTEKSADDIRLLAASFSNLEM